MDLQAMLGITLRPGAPASDQEGESPTLSCEHVAVNVGENTGFRIPVHFGDMHIHYKCACMCVRTCMCTHVHVFMYVSVCVCVHVYVCRRN